jgi:hypothetical protein
VVPSSPLMAKVGMPRSSTSVAAASSWVLKGLEAQSTTSAPPALRTSARLAVSVVMCRQADTRMPCKGFSLAKRSFISFKTGISCPAHSVLSFPFSASFLSLMSQFKRSLLFCSFLSLFPYDTRNSLSCERRGFDILAIASPSLPLCGIPYSLIYAKQSRTLSSPPRGEET